MNDGVGIRHFSANHNGSLWMRASDRHEAGASLFKDQRG